jgi:MoaA/NifB/PqqE/SkfB family radical SAM enzyme
MILRLLITEECKRDCAGCCNKQWDLSKLPLESRFDQYEMILLTGGEPMLDAVHVYEIIGRIKRQTNAPIYMYTAKVDEQIELLILLAALDGITVTLHTQDAVEAFLSFNTMMNIFWKDDILRKKSYRLNIFKGVEMPNESWDSCGVWKIKKDIEWIADCPLPEGEVFKRIDPSILDCRVDQSVRSSGS